MNRTNKKKTKRHHKRRTRKQKGGTRVPIFYKITNANKKQQIRPMNVIINETRPLNVFNQFKTQNAEALEKETKDLYMENGVTPRYIMVGRENRSRVGTRNDWHTKTKHFKKENIYTFEYKDETLAERKARYASYIPSIREILEKYIQSHGAVKVIPGSSAARADADVNVKQQFKFAKPPLSPIVLIDPVFFEQGRYEFFEYLKFQEIERGEHFRTYKKPAGVPFEINPEESALGLSKEEKEAYLAEVQKQATAAGVDQTKEFEICCIKLSIEGMDLNSEPNSGSYHDLIQSLQPHVSSYWYRD